MRETICYETSRLPARPFSARSGRISYAFAGSLSKGTFSQPLPAGCRWLRLCQHTVALPGQVRFGRISHAFPDSPSKGSLWHTFAGSLSIVVSVYFYFVFNYICNYFSYLIYYSCLSWSLVCAFMGWSLVYYWGLGSSRSVASGCQWRLYASWNSAPIMRWHIYTLLIWLWFGWLYGIYFNKKKTS